MKIHRKKAKDKLLASTKTEFKSIIEESNVTEEARDIAFLKLIQKKSYVELSLMYHCSVERIRDIMAAVYDRAYSVIKGKLI